MRILCLTPWFPSHRQDQHGNYILDSVEALVDLGHEVVVLVTKPWRPLGSGYINKEWTRKKIRVEEFSDKFKLHQCHYISIPRSYLCSFSNWSYRTRVNPLLEKITRQYQCELIHAHTELAGVAAVDVGRRLKIPTVITLHGISTEPKLYRGKTKKLLYEYALRNTDRVVLVGNPPVDFFKNLTRKYNHYRVVYNGFRPYSKHMVDEKKYCPENKIRFISVSNLLEGKGIDINLHALAKLNQKGITDWNYKIVGDGSERKKLKELAIKLNLTKNIIFLGACNHNEVYSHLLQSDVFILPSYREAFGIAYLEAMSCGLLTIAVEGQGPQAFIEHGKTGLLVPPNDASELSKTLALISKSRSHMYDIANMGKQHVYNHLTWHVHAQNLEKVYSEIVCE